MRLVAGFEGGETIAFFARSKGGARVHDLLEFLAAAAKGRGWDVTIHRVGDPEAELGWPTGRYGPPRTLQWWRDRKASESTKARAQWSAILVRVRGPLAEALLQHELGVWHFEEDGGRLDTLELVRMGDDYEIPAAMLNPSAPPQADPYALPQPLEPATLVRLASHRRWTRDGQRWTVTLAAAGAAFSFETLADYALALERVQFAARAEAAVKQEPE